MNAPTPARVGRPLSREDLREIFRLLNRYGLAQFGDEWGPDETNTWMIGDKWLEQLLNKLNRNG
jgi:hypothetical protein